MMRLLMRQDSTETSQAVTGSNVNATKELGEPNHAGNPERQFGVVGMDGASGRVGNRGYCRQFICNPPGSL